MIWLYTGTPGSGKSYHASMDVWYKLRSGGNVIANFPIKDEAVKRAKGHSIYADNDTLTAGFLVNYALSNHEIGKEAQTLVIIDECQILFNSREFGRKDRMSWIQFFAQHRKLGYNVILITQSDRMLDKQIRSLCETEIKHRKMGNYGVAGKLFSLFAGGTIFVAIEYWYGGNKLKIGQQLIRFRPRREAIYDSYRMFSDLDELRAGATVPGAGSAGNGAPGNGATASSVPEPEEPDIESIITEFS